MTTNHEPKPAPLTDAEIAGVRALHECYSGGVEETVVIESGRLLATIDRLRAERDAAMLTDEHLAESYRRIETLTRERDEAVKRVEEQAIEIDRLGVIYSEMRHTKMQRITTLQRQIEAAKEGLSRIVNDAECGCEAIDSHACDFREIATNTLAQLDSPAPAPVDPPVTSEVATPTHRQALSVALLTYQIALHEHCEDSMSAEILAIQANAEARKNVKLEIYEGRQPMRYGGD